MIHRFFDQPLRSWNGLLSAVVVVAIVVGLCWFVSWLRWRWFEDEFMRRYR